ncbi:MAG: nicotinate phosphoribosyltransferase, partial [Anaerolinea sp.]|nr:nicotinate phosphoribosyltransferase [Anaerolinea sp.]
MTRFNGQRLNPRMLELDIDGLRRGIYSDKYFENVVHVLERAAAAGYRYAGQYPRPVNANISDLDIGNLEVEAQVFMRRTPQAVIAGLDVALAMLAHATGWFDGDQFHNTADQLIVEAVEDGDIVPYNGDPEDVVPVLRIRGRYRDFALLETPILGVLTRASRIATNCYEVLKVSNGKPVLFF